MRNVPTRVCKILSSAPRLDSNNVDRQCTQQRPFTSRGFSRLPLYFTRKDAGHRQKLSWSIFVANASPIFHGISALCRL